MRLSLVVSEMLGRLALYLKRGFFCCLLDPEVNLTLDLQDCLDSNLKWSSAFRLRDPEKGLIQDPQDCSILGLKGGSVCRLVDPETDPMRGVQDCLSLGLKRSFACQNLEQVSVLH